MARLLPKRAGRLLEARLNYLCSLVEASAVDSGLEKLSLVLYPRLSVGSRLFCDSDLD